MLADVKAYLRIGTSDEDGVLGAMIAAATGLCEQFVGQWLMAREAEQMLGAGMQWQRLSARPVVAVLAVERVPETGAAVALPVSDYAVDIDGNGDGWVRMLNRPEDMGEGARVRVTYRAGMAVDEAGVPGAIRQGIVRLAAEHYARRDGGESDPPAAVAALWRPFRRMRLS